MRQALELALEALGNAEYGNYDKEELNQTITAIKEALAQPEEEKLHPVHIGVDVTKEGTAVTAFYRKPDAVMEVFYAQFHPMAQPEQEPVAIVHRNEYNEYRLEPHDNFDINSIPFNIDVPLFKSLQRTWVGLTDEDIWTVLQFRGYNTDTIAVAKAIEAKLKEKNT